MVIWLGLPHYPHQTIMIGWLSWSTLRLYDSWKTARVFGVLPNLLWVLRVLCTLWIFSVCICVFFSFLGGSFCLTRAHLDSPWWNRKKHTPSVKAPQGVLGLDEKHVSNNLVESKKKMSNYPGWSRGLNWRKGNTENDDADGGHDNEQKDDHDEEHEGRNHLTIAVESHHISVCCCPDDFIHSQTILTWVWPQIITTTPPPQTNGSLFSLSANQNTMPKVNHNHIESFKSMFVFSTVMFLVIAIYWIQAWSR